MQILAGELSIDNIFFANHLLAPEDDIVHVRRRNAGQLGNASGNDQAHWNVLRKVAILEVGHVLRLPTNLNLLHGMRQSTVALVGPEHVVDAGLITNVISVAGQHPVRYVMQTVQIQIRIALEQDALDFQNLVGYQAELLAGVLVGSLVEERGFVERFGHVAVAVESVGDGWVPHAVDVHQCNGKEVASGIEYGELPDEAVEDVGNALFGGAVLGTNDDLDLLFGTENFHRFPVFDDPASPWERLECEQVGVTDKVAAQVVNSAEVKSALCGHSTYGHSLP